MQKLLADNRSTSADTAITKDKRTLVLFVLGLALLLIAFWPFAGGNDARRCYKIALNEAGAQWQVISLPVSETINRPEILKALELQEDTALRPLIPEQETVGETPASLAMFINRPLPINRAGKEALEMLPGVGPHIASAILAELQQQGKFAGPDDLLKVTGIGPKSMQRLLPLINFE